MYRKLSKKKNEIIEKTLEDLCPLCGAFRSLKSHEKLVDRDRSLESVVTYEDSVSDITNSRGEFVGRRTETVPVSKIVTVCHDTYEIKFFCVKCQKSFSKFKTTSWEY